MPILVYLIAAIALDKYVVLSVDRHHRHLAKHIHYCLCFRFLVSLDIIAYAVYFLFDKLLLCLDHHTIEFFTPGDGIALYFGRIRFRLGSRFPCSRCHQQQECHYSNMFHRFTSLAVRYSLGTFLVRIHRW